MVEDENGEYLSVGEMVKSLLDSGESDFFHDALGLQELMAAHTVAFRVVCRGGTLMCLNNTTA